MLLSGEVLDLSADYTVRYKKTPQGDYYTLVAKGNDPMVKLVTLTFLDNAILEMVLIDGMSQKSTFTFSQVAVNKPIASKAFNFTIPKGADVIGTEIP